jgi:hypothetical protein
MSFLPAYESRQCVERYDRNYKIKGFSCWDQFLFMVFAQLTFYGTSENAVKTQIWIAISIYVRVAIIKKQLRLEQSLYSILQILSITLIEKMPLLQALSHMDTKGQPPIMKTS